MTRCEYSAVHRLPDGGYFLSRDADCVAHKDTCFLKHLVRLVADRRVHPGDPARDVLTRLIQRESGGSHRHRAVSGPFPGTGSAASLCAAAARFCGFLSMPVALA